jgi:hypothetical protein
MGSCHPKARDAASQEASRNLSKLFKKKLFSCGFEAAVRDVCTIIASMDGFVPDSLRNPERLAALTEPQLPYSGACAARSPYRQKGQKQPGIADRGAALSREECLSTDVGPDPVEPQIVTDISSRS